jgi:hypothetical protein
MANEDPTDRTSQPDERTAGAVLSSDTSLDAERLQVGLWRRMSPLEKARSVSEISRAVRDLSLVGIRRRHPGATDRECMMRFAMLTLGRELASQVYPETVALSGN